MNETPLPFTVLEITAEGRADSHRPAEGAPLIGEGRHHRAGAVHGRPAIVVNDGDEQIQVLGRSEERCFPTAALLTFTVTQDHERAVTLAAELRREREAGAHGQAVAE